MTIQKHTMLIGDAARQIGLGPDRLRQLDDELRPIRIENGQRRYDPAVIAKFAAKRAKAR